MKSFSWFSGKSESSRKYTGISSVDGLEGFFADDPCALHLAHRGPVVLHGVVLGVAVVPDGEAVLRPAPAHLVLRHGRLADQVVEQLAVAGRVVEAEAHIRRGVEVGEVRRE